MPDQNPASGQVPTSVDIYGMPFVVRGEGSPDQIRLVARHVDATMREIAHASGLSDTLKVAVLAALHIADDYFRARNELAQLETSLAGPTAECQQMLDAFLKSEP
jgi:cell division protein ZapA